MKFSLDVDEPAGIRGPLFGAAGFILLNVQKLIDDLRPGTKSER